MIHTIVKTACLEQCDWELIESEGRRLGLSRSASLRRIIREWAELALGGGRAAADRIRAASAQED